MNMELNMELNITEKAKEKLAKFQENNMPIKVKITGYSWCGATIGIVSEKQYENEKIYNADGIDIIVSEDLEGAMKGMKIDYNPSFFKKGFEVIPILY